jgi:CubicO group peptidase (beta-lactamase class C family)
MKKLLSIPVLIILCCCFQAKDSQSQRSAFGDIDARQQELIFAALKPFSENTQFAIAMINDGTTQFFGAKRQGDSVSIIINHDRAFEIGSISKVFTSTLLAEEVMSGKLHGNDDVAEVLGLKVKDNAKISLQQLANHTSGLPRLPANLNMFAVDPANPYRDYDEKKLQEYLTNELKTAQAPGTKYEYSNLAAGLLGYIIAKVNSRSYEELLQERIFTKYKMSTSTTDRSKLNGKLVKGLNPSGNEVPNWDLNVLMGAGGILSSAEDLSKFAVAQFDDSNAVMKLTRTETFKVNDVVSVGLGWHIVKSDGKEFYNHNGGTGGYRSSMTIDCKTKRGVVVLSNVSAFHAESKKIDELCGELLKTIE